MRRSCFVAPFVLLASCSDNASVPSSQTDAGASTDGGASDAGAADATSASDGASDAGTDAPHVPLPTPRFVSAAETCKLINAQNGTDPTPNDAQHRANLTGTDLGVPVVHQGSLYFFFGDTVGYQAIWKPGESHPDAVGYATAPYANVAANPSLLCTELRFLTLPPASSVGPTVDPSIQADFAAGAMTAPQGHVLGDFIHNPAGTGAGFPNLPGDFEVPSGAFSYGGSIYVFYTTVVSPQTLTMKASYLARWSAPATNALPNYDILYSVDERFDAAGALGGDFINVAAVVSGQYVYMFGTGDYRASPIHLARKRTDSLATAGGIERFDAASKTWKTSNQVAPIIADAVNGELSVRYFPAIGRWMMLNQEQSATMNKVIAHFSETPEGPWSEAVVVHDMADPAFRQAYCCTANACVGEQLFHCDRAGFYATYMLPEVRVQQDGSFVVAYVMSTWDPYNVALMEATFR